MMTTPTSSNPPLDERAPMRALVVEDEWPARNYLERLPAAERKRILDALTRLIDHPEESSLKKLQGRLEWSLRVGFTRVLMIPQEEQRLSRGDANRPPRRRLQVAYTLKNIFRR